MEQVLLFTLTILMGIALSACGGSQVSAEALHQQEPPAHVNGHGR